MKTIALPKPTQGAKRPTTRPKTLRLTAPEPSEGELQAMLIRRLRATGWLVVRVNSGARKTQNGGWFRAYYVAGLVDEKGRAAAAGFPDVMAFKGDGQGRVVMRLFEVKALGGVPRESQERFRDFARLHGVAVEIIEGLTGLEKWSSENQSKPEGAKEK